MPTYVVVERGSNRLLGRWLTPVPEVAQCEAELRNGIAVSARWLAEKTGAALPRFPMFGQPLRDNSRPPPVAYVEGIRKQIRQHERQRMSRKEAA